MIWFDRTTRSVVVGCRACGARDVALDQRMADSWAAEHLDRAHPKSPDEAQPERAKAVTAARVRRYRST